MWLHQFLRPMSYLLHYLLHAHQEIMPLLAILILHLCCFYPARRYGSFAHLSSWQTQVSKAGAECFANDCGFPNETKHYEALLHNVESSVILQKLKYPAPPLDKVNPLFLCTYDEAKHGKQMRRDLDLSHLEPHIRNRAYALVKKYLPVFDKNGVFVLVKHYECVIDTGDSPPITIKKIFYEPKETPIMRRAIAALKKVSQIHQITNGCWLFKALLAPKPHQEHEQNIDNVIWCFCVNYIPLNSITRIIAYLIPRCNSAINEEFGLGVLYWLFDAPMGYHQLAIALASQEKLAPQGPNAFKWTYPVMPFGPTNGPVTFINFIHDINSLWKALAEKSGLIINNNTNTKIIVNDIFSWAKTIDNALLYIECQLCVCQSYIVAQPAQESYLSQMLPDCLGSMFVQTVTTQTCQSINS
jgi:hypothetical protein